MTDAPERIFVPRDENGRLSHVWWKVREHGMPSDETYIHAATHEKNMEGIRAKDELLDHVKAVLLGALEALHSIEVSEGPDLSKDKEPIENAIAKLDNERLFGIHEPVIVLDKFAVSPSD